MALNRRGPESVYGCAASGDPRNMVKAILPEPQQPSGIMHFSPETRLIRCCLDRTECRWPSEPFPKQAMVNETTKVVSGAPTLCCYVPYSVNAGLPTGRESYGNGATVVVRGRESRPHGEGWQVTAMFNLRGTRDA